MVGYFTSTPAVIWYDIADTELVSEKYNNL